MDNQSTVNTACECLRDKNIRERFHADYDKAYDFMSDDTKIWIDKIQEALKSISHQSTVNEGWKERFANACFNANASGGDVIGYLTNWVEQNLLTPPLNAVTEEKLQARPDGVHTFKEMEALALGWKNKYNKRVDESQNLHNDYCLFLETVARSLGIQTGREKWRDNTIEGRKEIITEKIKSLKEREDNVTSDRSPDLDSVASHTASVGNSIEQCCEQYGITPDVLVSVYRQHLERIRTNLPLLFHSKGVELIAEERLRQTEKEGWTPEHDALHDRGELAKAAACYAVHHTDAKVKDPNNIMSEGWPWDYMWWKPSEDKIRNLVKSGALIAAEIDRLLNSNSTPERSDATEVK